MAKKSSSCRFCEIARGVAPAHRVLESELFVAFLDSRPLFPGHCLVTPREHWETLMDVPSHAVGALFIAVQRLSSAVESAMGADGILVAINNRVSQSVPHLHVHVVPRSKGDGLRGFFWPRQPYESEQAMEETAAAIREALANRH